MAESSRLVETVETQEQPVDKAQPEVLTRDKLKKLEEKEKTAFQNFLDIVIPCLPLVCGGLAILEYVWVPDKSVNKNPERYIYVLLFFIALYACVAAMERGEISGALLSDTFAYGMVKEGKLKCIRSLLDEDFANQNCCVIAMNRSFTQDNPVISKKVAQAVQKAHSYMRENPEEATKMLIEQGWNSGDFEKNVMLNNSLQFGLSQETTENTLKEIVDRYIRLKLIISMDNAEEVMKLAWTKLF